MVYGEILSCYQGVCAECMLCAVLDWAVMRVDCNPCGQISRDYEARGFS